MKFLIRSIIGFLLFVPLVSFAANGNVGFPETGNVGSPRTGNVGQPEDQVTLDNPLGKISTFPQLIEAVLDAVFVIGLPIAVFFIALAGLRFVLARGNSEKLTRARANLLWTVVGIAIFFGAWLLAKIIETTINALRSGLS